MRTIEKRYPPPSWDKHAKSGGIYEDFKDTDPAREALLREQGHLCCFCMARIGRGKMKIAHLTPQSKADTRTMDWKNVAGACMGGDGARNAVKHCDTAQGNTPIKVNPVDREQNCEKLIHYLPDGHIRSDDPDIDRDLHKTLNLNHFALKVYRKGILDALMTRLKNLHGRGYWQEHELQKELEAWRKRGKNGMLKEYCQVGIYWLEKKLARRQRVK
jgi:uncharacterized protein (TIGR02646 family)